MYFSEKSKHSRVLYFYIPYISIERTLLDNLGALFVRSRHQSVGQIHTLIVLKPQSTPPVVKL